MASGNGNPKGVRQQAPPVQGLPAAVVELRGIPAEHHVQQGSEGARAGRSGDEVVQIAILEPLRPRPGIQLASPAYPNIETKSVRAVRDDSVAGPGPFDVQAGA